MGTLLLAGHLKVVTKFVVTTALAEPGARWLLFKLQPVLVIHSLVAMLGLHAFLVNRLVVEGAILLARSSRAGQGGPAPDWLPHR